jgi:hypothetical protein
LRSTPLRWHSTQLDGFGERKIGKIRCSKRAAGDGSAAMSDD